jgi:protein transport protein SEC24
VNPDAGFGMQLSIEESLADVQNVCFQAAVLYTSSKGMKLLLFSCKNVKKTTKCTHIYVVFFHIGVF